MGRGVSASIQEGKLMDWSRNGLDLSIAYEQVAIILSTTIHAIEAIRGMSGYLRERSCQILKTSSVEQRSHLVTEMDLLLEQIAAIVSEASLGDINLLGEHSGCLSIPYLLTEVREEDAFHSFVTMGMSISVIHEEIPGIGERLVGIYSLSTDECDPVCWLSSPKVWSLLQSKMEVDALSCEEFEAEILAFTERLIRFDRALELLHLQLNQYMKMVGEVVTDPVFEN